MVGIEKTLLRKVGEAIERFRMVREGDRVAVAVSGGKDSMAMLEALLLLQKRAPINFSVCAFTVEQGKFLRPIEPIGEYLKQRGVAWSLHRDNPSIRLIDEQPDHGCDLCSRYRRRAVYQIARGLGANVIAFGHTADDFCESLLRNALFPPEGFSFDPAARFCTGDRHARLFRGAQNSRHPLRLLPKDRHGSRVDSQLIRRPRSGAPSPEGDASLRHGQYRTLPLIGYPLSEPGRSPREGARTLPHAGLTTSRERPLKPTYSPRTKSKPRSSPRSC